MSLGLQKADAFREDFTLQALWYVRQAGDEVARRFERAVDSTLRPSVRAAESWPGAPVLSSQVARLAFVCRRAPVPPLLVFYRVDTETVQAVRLMHGTRDLPRRLAEPPGAAKV